MNSRKEDLIWDKTSTHALFCVMKVSDHFMDTETSAKCNHCSGHVLIFSLSVLLNYYFTIISNAPRPRFILD